MKHAECSCRTSSNKKHAALPTCARCLQPQLHAVVCGEALEVALLMPARYGAAAIYIAQHTCNIPAQACKAALSIGCGGARIPDTCKAAATGSISADTRCFGCSAACTCGSTFTVQPSPNKSANRCSQSSLNRQAGRHKHPVHDV